jgi:hypothetical protein
LGKPRHLSQLRQVLLEWPGGCTPDRFPGANNLRGKHTAAGAEDSSAFNAGFIANTDLAADNGVMAYQDATGEAGLSGNDDVILDAAIVGDVDHVVELDAVSDRGEAEGGAIDARIGAQFDVIAQGEAADLGEFFPTARDGSEAKAIGAQYDSRMQNDARANGNTRIDRDSRVKPGARAKADAAAKHAV